MSRKGKQTLNVEMKTKTERKKQSTVIIIIIQSDAKYARDINDEGRRDDDENEWTRGKNEEKECVDCDTNVRSKSSHRA